MDKIYDNINGGKITIGRKEHNMLDNYLNNMGITLPQLISFLLDWWITEGITVHCNEYFHHTKDFPTPKEYEAYDKRLKYELQFFRPTAE